MNYLKELGFSEAEISALPNTLKPEVTEKLSLFPEIVKLNYKYLKDLGISNYKEIFLGHTQMFFQNPDRFKKIFEKYDKSDLIRCLEKNGAVIEKL